MSETVENLEAIQVKLKDIRFSLAATGELPRILLTCVSAVLVDLETGIIIYATPPADELFGYIEGELSGSPLGILIPERVRNIHNEHFRKFANEPSVRPMGALTMKLAGQHRKGHEFPVEIGLFPRVVSGRRCTIAIISAGRQ